jgi:hypothetical protein
MLDRIISDPAILGGKPLIRGARISVEIILEATSRFASVSFPTSVFSSCCFGSRRLDGISIIGGFPRYGI